MLLRRDPNGVEVEVLLLRVDRENVPPCRQAHPILADELEGAPTAGVGHEDRPRDVHPIDFHVPLAGRESAADRRFQAIGPGLGDADRVGEPLPGLNIVDRIAGPVGDDVHIFIGPVQAAGVARDRIVIRDAFAAVVEVLGLDQPRHHNGDAFVGRPACGGRERLVGGDRQIPGRIFGFHPVVIQGAG